MWALQQRFTKKSLSAKRRHHIPFFESYNKAIIVLTGVTVMKGLLFLVLASLAAPLVLWQHSCGISIASKLNLTLLDVFELSSPHTPFSLTTLLSSFIFCTVWSNCFWCDIILSRCYLPECQPGLGRHPRDALSVETPGKCFPYWCCVSLTVVTHRRDSHSEIPPWWIGLRLESLLLMLQPFPGQRGMMEPLQRESTIFIYYHTSMWNLFQKSCHRTTQ